MHSIAESVAGKKPHPRRQRHLVGGRPTGHVKGLGGGGEWGGRVSSCSTSRVPWPHYGRGTPLSIRFSTFPHHHHERHRMRKKKKKKRVRLFLSYERKERWVVRFPALPFPPPTKQRRRAEEVAECEAAAAAA